MDYSVLGDAVILAQRLESAAPAGETYVGETTLRLTERRFEMERLEDLTLKGKAEPVPAWRLLGKREESSSTRIPLVARGAEVEQIGMRLERVAEGWGQVVSITGEPGVGKSRLTAEIRAQALSHGVRWLSTRCLTYGASIPYWPFAELIRSLADVDLLEAPDQARATIAKALGAEVGDAVIPYLARLAGLPAPELEEMDAEDLRRELHLRVPEAFAGLARVRPVVLAIEDLHWADASSIALTVEIVRLCQGTPLMVLLTARREALAVLMQIAGEMEEDRRAAIQLEPLQPSDTPDLVAAILSGPADAQVVELVNELATGNPFFAEELLRSLSDVGALERREGRWFLSSRVQAKDVPPTIEGLLSSRIDRLPRAAASILQAASVIGRRVPLLLLDAVADEALEVNLPVLVEGGFLDRQDPEISSDTDDRLVFHHALMQDVAYSRLLRRQRRTLHGHVAEAAKELYGEGDDAIDLLARHLYLADSGAEAIPYLIRAGERAASLFANEEALLHLEHAAEIARKQDDQKLLFDVLLKVADLHELKGSYEEAERLYEEVRDGGDPRGWRGIAAAKRNRSDYAQALEVAEQGLATGLPAERQAELWLERAWTRVRQGDLAAAVADAEAGLACCAGNDIVEAQLLLQVANARTTSDQPEAGVEPALRGSEILERAGNLRLLPTALRLLGAAYREAGDGAAAADALRRGLALAERTGNAEEIAGCLINLGMLEFERDDVIAAIGYDRRAVEHFERLDHPYGRALAYGNLAEKLAHAKEDEEAILFSQKALELAEEIDHQPTIADVTQTRALIQHNQQRFAEAGATAEEAAERFLALDLGAPAAASFRFAAGGVRQEEPDEDVLVPDQGRVGQALVDHRLG
jgi:tetratricopeptide (TPR) repeat protein